MVWLAVVAAAVLVGSAPAAAAEMPEGAQEPRHYRVVSNGAELGVTVWLPKDATGPVPVVLNMSIYNGTGPVSRMLDGEPPGDGPRINYAQRQFLEEAGLFERGYAWAQAEMRGAGSSSGCWDQHGPKDQSDVKNLVRWAAEADFSSGSVAVHGLSADGWPGVAALADPHPGLKAVITMAPPADLYAINYFNGIRTIYAPGIVPVNAAWQVAPPGPADSEHAVGATTGPAEEPGCGINESTAMLDRDEQASFWRERDLTERAAGSDVPVFYTHGFIDSHVSPIVATPLWRAVRSAEKRMWLGQFHHFTPYADVSGNPGFSEEAVRFLDRHVRGVSAAPDPRVEVQDSTGQWRAERRWPSRRSEILRTPILGGSYENRRGNHSEPFSRNPFAPFEHEGAAGIGSWTFTPPARRRAHLTGNPAFRVEVAAAPPGAHLVGLLYDIRPDGSARFITRGGRRINGPGSYRFKTLPQDWALAKGHRLGILLAASDDNDMESPLSGGTVEIAGGLLKSRFQTKLGELLMRSETPAMAWYKPFQIPVEPGTRTAGEGPPRVRN